MSKQNINVGTIGHVDHGRHRVIMHSRGCGKSIYEALAVKQAKADIVAARSKEDIPFFIYDDYQINAPTMNNDIPDWRGSGKRKMRHGR